MADIRGPVGPQIQSQVPDDFNLAMGLTLLNALPNKDKVHAGEVEMSHFNACGGRAVEELIIVVEEAQEQVTKTAEQKEEVITQVEEEELQIEEADTPPDLLTKSILSRAGGRLKTIGLMTLGGFGYGGMQGGQYALLAGSVLGSLVGAVVLAIPALVVKVNDLASSKNKMQSPYRYPFQPPKQKTNLEKALTGFSYAGAVVIGIPLAIGGFFAAGAVLSVFSMLYGTIYEGEPENEEEDVPPVQQEPTPITSTEEYKSFLEESQRKLTSKESPPKSQIELSPVITPEEATAQVTPDLVDSPIPNEEVVEQKPTEQEAVRLEPGAREKALLERLPNLIEERDETDYQLKAVNQTLKELKEVLLEDHYAAVKTLQASYRNAENARGTPLERRALEEYQDELRYFKANHLPQQIFRNVLIGSTRRDISDEDFIGKQLDSLSNLPLDRNGKVTEDRGYISRANTPYNRGVTPAIKEHSGVCTSLNRTLAKQNFEVNQVKEELSKTFEVKKAKFEALYEQVKDSEKAFKVVSPPKGFTGISDLMQGVHGNIQASNLDSLLEKIKTAKDAEAVSNNVGGAFETLDRGIELLQQQIETIETPVQEQLRGKLEQNLDEIKNTYEAIHALSEDPSSGFPPLPEKLGHLYEEVLDGIERIHEGFLDEIGIDELLGATSGSNEVLSEVKEYLLALNDYKKLNNKLDENLGKFEALYETIEALPKKGVQPPPASLKSFYEISRAFADREDSPLSVEDLKDNLSQSELALEEAVSYLKAIAPK